MTWHITQILRTMPSSQEPYTMPTDSSLKDGAAHFVSKSPPTEPPRKALTIVEVRDVVREAMEKAASDSVEASYVVEVVTPHRDGRGYISDPDTSPPDPSGGWEPFGVGSDGSIFWKKRA